MLLLSSQCRFPLPSYDRLQAPHPPIAAQWAPPSPHFAGRGEHGHFTGIFLMLAQEFIRQKRDGKELAPADIAEFIAGLTSGTVSEGQAAAFAMAVFLRGM